MLADPQGEGALALGPAYAMALNLVASIKSAAHKDSLAATAMEAETKGTLAIDAIQFDEQALYTNQTCYLGPDETEMCVYSGVLCYDGAGPVVVTSEPIFETVDDLVHSCVDNRFQEPAHVKSTGCKRGVFPGESLAPYSLSAQKGSNSPLRFDGTYPLDARRWGPANRGSSMLFREVHAAQVWGDKGEVLLPLVTQSNSDKAALKALAGLISLGSSRHAMKLEVPQSSSPDGQFDHLMPLDGLDVATKVLEMGPIPHPLIPGLTLLARTQVGDVDIDWVEPGMWLVALETQEGESPLRWMRRVMGLYDAHRANASLNFGDHPRDGFMHFLESWMVASAPSVYTDTPSSNRIEYKVGPQWDMPPMTNIVFNSKNTSAHTPAEYFLSLLNLAAPGSKPFFTELQNTLSRNHMVCTTKGGIPGSKHRIFTGRTDASMFKTYAYQKLGLGVQGIRPHPRYAPRKIILLKSAHSHDIHGENPYGELASSRIWNWEEVETVVADTGVPYEVLETTDGLSFEETVKKFSSTGIIISPHGDSLSNIVFLPAHSVVVELFPYAIKRNTFRQLSNLLDLHYLPYFSDLRIPLDKVDMDQPEGAIYTQAYWDSCESKNATGFDSVSNPVCIRAQEDHPVVVDTQTLKFILRDAVDCSASFSLKNPDWAALASEKGMPVAPPPEKIGDDKYGTSPP